MQKVVLMLEETDWPKEHTRKASYWRGLNTFGNLIQDEGGISSHQSKDRFLNKWQSDNWMAIWKKINLDPYLIPHTYHILNNECITPKCKEMKWVPKESMGEFLPNFGVGEANSDSKFRAVKKKKKKDNIIARNKNSMAKKKK